MWLGEPPRGRGFSLHGDLLRPRGVASPDLRGVLPVDWPGCAVGVPAPSRSCLTVRAGGWTASANASTGKQQPTQNWHGPGEPDCLIKTEHCERP